VSLDEIIGDLRARAKAAEKERDEAREDVRALAEARNAAMDRLMDMRSLPGWDASPLVDGHSTIVQAQTIAGDAWRILETARPSVRRETAAREKPS
jgi:hypothetical protein